MFSQVWDGIYFCYYSTPYDSDGSYMTNVSPQLKTNELIEKLVPSIESGVNLLGDFGLRVVIREARKIPDLFQSLLVTGLAEIVGDNYPAAMEIHKQLKSISPYNDVIWVNFSVALGQRCQYRLARDISIESIPYVGFAGLCHAYLNAGYWADIETMLAIKSQDLFQAYDPSSFSDKQKADILRCNAIMNELLKDREESDYLSKMALLVMQIAEGHKFPPSQTSIHTDAEGMLIFSFGIPTDRAELLWGLNDELASLIVDKRLFSANSIATFHVIGA